jgi:SlyX protein
MIDEERVVELETTIAYQGDLIRKLQELASKQQLELHRLEQRVDELVDQFKEVAPSMIRDPADESPPPHY